MIGSHSELSFLENYFKEFGNWWELQKQSWAWSAIFFGIGRANNENIKIVKECLEGGVTLKWEPNSQRDIFEGAIFVFTGSLEKLNRKEAKEKVEEMSAEEMKKITGGLPLPPGMKMPF